MTDLFADIADREFYHSGYPVLDHLLFAPWKGYGDYGRRASAAKVLIADPRMYFIHQAAVQALMAGPGEIWELGVYKGESAAFLAVVGAHYDRTIRLFDTFEGMPLTDPQEDRFHQKGDFSDTSLQGVKVRVGSMNKAIHYHPGLVPETFAGLEESTIAFAHVDMDIFAPIKAACEFIFPRLRVGGFMIFDDYGWASCPGARKAVDGFLLGRPEQPFSLPTGQCLIVKQSN